MLYYEPNSVITIGGLKFSGVHEVRIKRGLHSYSEWASIKIPFVANVVTGKRSTPALVSMITLVKDGDAVEVQLGYNGDLITEFKGFVKRRNKLVDMLEIECEGYVRKLRLNVDITKNFTKTSAKELLQLACKGTGITVQCPVDFPLSGIKLLHADGCKIIDHIKKCSEGIINVFFIKPDVLWCGLVYTPYLAGTHVFSLPTVKYRIGWNTASANNLKERVPSEPVQVIINGISVTGDSVRTDAKDKTAARTEKMYLNNVPDQAILKKFAQEKVNQMNYTGYEGTLMAFLQPLCEPGYLAYVLDNQNQERTAYYLVESTEVIFGVNGGFRNVEVGPKLTSK